MLQHVRPQSGIASHFEHSSAPIEAATFIRKMRGRSQSILVEARDRRLYVVKLNCEHGNLANELIGTSLCNALGLSAPGGHFLSFTEHFIQHYPNAWRRTPEGPMRPSAGLHFATAFVGAAEGPKRPFEILLDASRNDVQNREHFCGMYLFDVWANHLDRRQSIYLPDGSRKKIEAVFVDNGLLFGGASWRSFDPSSQIPFRQKDAINVEWSTAVMQGWFERFKAIIPGALAKLIKIVPPDWCVDDLGGLEQTLLKRLGAIEEIVKPFVPREQS